MRPRLTSSHFIGRHGELAELELAWREAAAERPVLVLLGGDSGVGKTRLLAEFERRLAADGAVGVLRGEAIEPGDGELPYAPLVAALRPLVRAGHPALEALSGGSRAELSALLPGLGDGERAERHDPSAQLRLFEALLELLALLSDEHPLALIIEDMHWADRSTRAFVAFLARSLRRERVLLLLSYRSDELHRRHALRPLLAELERLERARRIQLAPLDRGELAEVLADILGAPAPAELLERLYLRGEGNPLYTEELLAAGLDGRGSAPQSLRDAFLLRTERLPAAAQRAARVLAVGRRLDEETLREVTGIDRDELTQALREAVAEQILVPSEDGRFAFRHALLREALYDDLLPGERGELHLALARWLEQRPIGGGEREVERAGTIAGHYASAGEQPAALRASITAALAAQRVHAYGEAADLAERALELWPRVPEGERPPDLDHVELLVLAAAAHSAVEDRARSEVLLNAALGELDERQDTRRYASVLARLARTQWSLNRGLEGVQTAQRALGMLPAGELSQERAALLAWLSRTRFLRGKFRRALSEGEEALAAARAVGDARSETEVLNTLGMSRIALGDVEAGVSCLRRAIELAREAGDLDGLGYAYSNLADLLNLRGRTGEALAVAREGLQSLPRRIGLGRDWMLLTLSEIELDAGEWAAAREHVAACATRSTGVLEIFCLLREAELALGAGEEERALSCLQRVRPLVADSSEPQWIGSLGALLGELLRRRGELEAARGVVGEALDRIELCTDDVMRIARVAAAGARLEADAAVRARDLRERAAEREAVKRARLHSERLAAVASDGGPVERAWSAVGVAELGRARGRSDPDAWSRAARLWEELERPYVAAQVRWREAEAAAEAGQRERAGEAAAAALQTARRLPASWLEAEVLALVARARLELEDNGAARAEAAEDPFGLTARERQVLALIAEGATNRQIGQALYMAEKTASVHVSRILAKLGVRSRTQAAAVAHRLHLRG